MQVVVLKSMSVAHLSKQQYGRDVCLPQQTEVNDMSYTMDAVH